MFLYLKERKKEKRSREEREKEKELDIIVFFLCARKYFISQGCSSEEDRQNSCLQGAYILMRETDDD